VKRLLILGATSGIAFEVIKKLSDGDNELVLVARNKEKLDDFGSHIGTSIKKFICDFQEADNLDALFEEFKKEKLKFDAMVYCVGVGGFSGVRGIDIDEVENIFKLNYWSYLKACSLFVKKMFSNDGASIVCLSSLASKTCYAGTTAYGCSKEAMNTLNKILSKECISRKIRVNSVLPGYVHTTMTSELQEEQLYNEQPWGFIEPTEVADVIDFLLSDSARMITGSEIVISGGMVF